MTVFNVPNKTILFALGNKSPGEIAYCEEEKEYMIYENEEWRHLDMKMPDAPISMSAYDINKQLYSQAKPIEDFKEVKNYFDKAIPEHKHWLLYGKEISYFTVFEEDADCGEKFADCFFDCLSNISDEIKGFEYLEDGSLEIWIKVKETELVTVLYLFDYTEGIVYYE